MVRNGAGTNGVLEVVFAGDKLVKRFMNIES